MSDRIWHVVINGQPVGPLTVEELTQRLPMAGGPNAMVWQTGAPEWVQARTVPEIAGRMQAPATMGGPGMPPVPGAKLEYTITGDDMQFVEIMLDPGQVVQAEPGSMMYMGSAIRMDTHFGDPSAQQQTGFLDKLKAAGKRVLTGESLFITTFTNTGGSREPIAFAAPYPGKIIPMGLAEFGGELIVQKDSFLAAALGIQIGIAFQKKIGVALFGGEGFIMQRLTGQGTAMVHAGGTVTRRSLKAGETLRLDTGCLVALQPSVNYDIQFTGGFKNTLFGGEGLFLATLTGPGDVWLQSLPFSRLASRVLRNVGSGRDEGNLLGGLGLGTIFGGDN